MSYGYGVPNMCDSGIDGTVERIRDAVKNLVTEIFENGDIDETPDIVKDENGEKTVEDWNNIPQMVTDHVVDNLDEALEGVVQDIDEHLETVKNEARDEGYESGMESACQDMVPYEDLADMEQERDDAVKERDELEEKVDELELSKNEITFEGEVFRYVPERQVFVSRIGTVLALSRTETEMVSICTVW